MASPRLRIVYPLATAKPQPTVKPGRKLGITLTPTRIKTSQYLLIPKDLAELLEIDDHSILNLTIEETSKGQRLVYSVQERTHNP